MKSKSERLAILETAYSSIGKVAPAGTPEEFPTFSARHIQADARMAEALAFVTDTPVIEQVRCLLYRGDTESAELLLNKNLEKTELELLDNEFKFELARFHAISGKWTEALVPLQEYLNAQPPTIGMLTALQVRALCLYELGAFDRAAKDIDLLSSFERILPHAPVLKYVAFMRIKLAARTHSVSTARKDLHRLLAQFVLSEKFNWDILLTWARAEIELSRLEGKDGSRWAFVSLIAAEKLGDKQYHAQALLDLSLSRNAFVANWAATELSRSGGGKSSRVQTLLEDLKQSSGSGPSTSGQSLIDAVNTDSADTLNDFSTQDLAELIENVANGAIFVRETELLIHMRECKLELLSGRQQLVKAVSVLAENPSIEKEDLFSKVWELSFNQETHDPAIRTLLKRIREKIPISIESKSGLIRTKGLLII